MGTPETSADNVTFRPSDAPTPKFTGIALPPVMRELSGPANTNPSDMTALANRLRVIRFDLSPEGSPNSSKLACPSPGVGGLVPVALDFESPNSSTDKENVPNAEALNGQETPSTGSKRRPRSRPFGEMIATAEPVAFNISEKKTPKAATGHGEAKIVDDSSILPEVTWEAEAEHSISPHGKSITEHQTITLPELTPEKEHVLSPSVEIEAPPPIENLDVENATLLGEPSTFITDAAVVTLPAHSSTPPHTSSSSFSNAVIVSSPEEQLFVPRQAPAETTSQSTVEVRQPSPLLFSKNDSKESNETLFSPAYDDPALASERNVDEVDDIAQAKPLAAKETDQMVDTVNKYIELLSLSKAEKRGWPERCEAMNGLNAAVSGDVPAPLATILNRALPSLSSTLNDQLVSLRPTTIGSALGLFEGIVQSELDVNDFLSDVFPSVMDLASGSSLRASEAAASVALALHHRPALSEILSDVDDPLRLIELLEQIAEKSELSDAERERARVAVNVVKEKHPHASGELGYNGTSTPVSFSRTPARATPVPSRRVESTVPRPQEPATPSSKRPAQHSVLPGHDSATLLPSPQQGTPRHGSIQGLGLRRADSHTPSANRGASETETGSSRMSARLSSRLSWRAKLQTPGLISGQGFPITNEASLGGPQLSSEGGVAQSPPARELALPPPSPQSTKKRLYTSEDLEEARKAAMRVCMEEASHANQKERENREKERNDLRASLKRERDDNCELQSVLAEYEATMQKMVAQSNSQASQQQSVLETEKSRLKAALLEVSEAFEKLKEKYEAAKQDIALRENKENRLIDQVKDLKTNMVALQKWSNDLKANAEKKLAKSFEAVTTYRASYLDKEAHANKAMSDLERTKSELEKTVANLATTAANVSRLETELHQVQDAKTEAEATLASTKVSLSRVSAARDRLQGELDDAHKELGDLRGKVIELNNAAMRAADAQKTIDGIMSENQSLKARAYDDMTKIRRLEGELEEKDREVEELNALCEEAMTQLEAGKLR